MFAPFVFAYRPQLLPSRGTESILLSWSRSFSRMNERRKALGRQEIGEISLFFSIPLNCLSLLVDESQRWPIAVCNGDGSERHEECHFQQRNQTSCSLGKGTHPGGMRCCDCPLPETRSPIFRLRPCGRWLRYFRARKAYQDLRADPLFPLDVT